MLGLFVKRNVHAPDERLPRSAPLATQRAAGQRAGPDGADRLIHIKGETSNIRLPALFHCCLCVACVAHTFETSCRLAHLVFLSSDTVGPSAQMRATCSR